LFTGVIQDRVITLRPAERERERERERVRVRVRIRIRVRILQESFRIVSSH
jgi:hypothetical protein